MAIGAHAVEEVPSSYQPPAQPQPQGGRAEWEATMHAFGVHCDVDAMSRRRHVSPTIPMPTRSEMGRRAAQYGDIVDLLGRKHYKEVPGANSGAQSRTKGLETLDIDAQQRRRQVQAGKASIKRAASAVLPMDSETYDMLGASRPGHRYFDGISRAQEYAELIGRPGSSHSHHELLRGALLELGSGDKLPLAIRRVLASTMPTAGNPDFRGEGCLERLRESVERRVMQQCCDLRKSVSCDAHSEETQSTVDAEETLHEDATYHEENTVASVEAPSFLNHDFVGGITMRSPRDFAGHIMVDAKAAAMAAAVPARPMGLPTLLRGGSGYGDKARRQEDLVDGAMAKE